MKNHIYRIIALLCFTAILFAGCSNETNSGPDVVGSEIWEEMPALTFGTLEYDKLEVLPWNSGRCEATASNRMAESNKGYYCMNADYLHYADKSNLGNWVKVCNKPDCAHGSNMTCNANLGSNEFVIKDGRIYFVPYALGTLWTYTGVDTARILVSMAPDGTDWRLAYRIEDVRTTTPASYISNLTSEYWLSMFCEMDQDGRYTTKVFRVSEQGEQLLHEETKKEITISFDSAQLFRGVHGDVAITSNLLGDTQTKVFRVVDDGFQEVDLTGYPMAGSYLSGNTLRFFRPNDGYYDVDLTTGEEVFLAPVRMENSWGQVVLPNCIVESTLSGWNPEEARMEGIQNAMELFDGESWHTVKLPEEFVNAGPSMKVTVRCITSDSILFTCYDINELMTSIDNAVQIYRIPLGRDEYVMEYCGVLS